MNQGDRRSGQPTPGQPTPEQPSPGQPRRAFASRPSGFSLIEMAMVLAALTLILSGVITPLGHYIDKQRTTRTHNELDAAHDALMGYAVSNGASLPCPDHDGDGTSDVTAGPIPCRVQEGYLPSATLGVRGFDGWGRRLRYRPDNAFTEPGGLGNPPNTTSRLQVRNRAGVRLTVSDPHSSAAIVFSCGKNGIPDDDNRAKGVIRNCSQADASDSRYVQDVTTPDEFDDVLIWVSKNILLNRLVAAGLWPTR
ncbi:MAG: type II secretion system protein [Pseudomonadota bacterium]